MLRIAAEFEAGKFGLPREDAVGAEMNVIATVFFVQDLAIAGHQHRDGVGEQKHFCSDGSGQAIGAGMADAGVFQIHRVHQVMQSHMGVAAAQTGEKWGEKSGEGNQRITSKGAEKKIEPNHVGLKFVNCTQNMKPTGRIVE
ncbi:MAG: hypothetical protein WB919_18555 [Candidatus Sulfotelmatobacter sp.]